MNETHSLIAFLATLISIVVLVIVGATASYFGAKVEAMGVGAAVTGLIGIAGSFRPKTQASAAP